MKISVCMIVKNEEAVLERILRQAKQFASEIIVVDTGSTDNTVKIAQKYARVEHFKWCEDFSEARNYSFSFATCDYIMWLDADDFIPESEINKIKNLKPDFDVLMLKYVTSFDKNFKPITEFYRERIIKRSLNLRWKDAIHEAITPTGKILYKDIRIYHKKEKQNPIGRNLKIYEKMIKSHIALTPRQQFYYSRELMYNKKYSRSIASFKKFLKGEGWIENKIEACLNLAWCYEAKGQLDDAKKFLLQSFTLSTPRAEVLCEFGNILISENKFKEAIWWFESALIVEKPLENGAFVNSDCYNFLPFINLCVCYSRLGDIEKAYKFHLLSQKEKPEHESVRQNDEYFKKLFAGF